MSLSINSLPYKERGRSQGVSRRTETLGIHGVAGEHYWENHKEASRLGAEASDRISSVRKQYLGEGLNSIVDILWHEIISSFS